MVEMLQVFCLIACGILLVILLSSLLGKTKPHPAITAMMILMSVFCFVVGMVVIPMLVPDQRGFEHLDRLKEELKKLKP